jgi:hypothetical protein
MGFRALRLSGIALSGALIGGAALFAMSAKPTNQPRPHAPTPVTAATQASVFAVSLRGDGPMARAQRLAMRGGQETAAGRQVERQLMRQRAFRGLCFQGFTRRGDIIVRMCREENSGADWQARLRAMPAVTNVEPLDQSAEQGRRS